MTRFYYMEWFEEISIDDVACFGGKYVSLGEISNKLISKCIRILDYFTTTVVEADRWHFFMTDDDISRMDHAQIRLN